MFRDIILMVLKQMNKTTSYSIGIISLEFTYASVSILSFTLKHESTLFLIFNLDFTVQRSLILPPAFVLQATD